MLSDGQRIPEPILSVSAFRGPLKYSLIERTPERELLPMARELDLAVTPWAILGAGLLTGKYLAGRVPEGDEAEWMKRSIREAIQIANATDASVISDEEIHSVEGQQALDSQGGSRLGQ